MRNVRNGCVVCGSYIRVPSVNGLSGGHIEGLGVHKRYNSAKRPIDRLRIVMRQRRKQGFRESFE